MELYVYLHSAFQSCKNDNFDMNILDIFRFRIDFGYSFL